MLWKSSAATLARFAEPKSVSTYSSRGPQVFVETESRDSGGATLDVDPKPGQQIPRKASRTDMPLQSGSVPRSSRRRFSDVSTSNVINVVTNLSADESDYRIIVQHPTPAQINERAVVPCRYSRHGCRWGDHGVLRRDGGGRKSFSLLHSRWDHASTRCLRRGSDRMHAVVVTYVRHTRRQAAPAHTNTTVTYGESSTCRQFVA